MYKYQARNTKPLFQELFPFGGKLDKENMWLKVAEVIPWKELEGVYAARHAKRGRPAKDSRLIVGLLAIKHMTELSDEEVLESVRENPYQQAFCGFDQLVTDKILDPSTLTKQRKRLGKEVEFGSKAGCDHVDGFVFLDHLEHRAFAEEGFVREHVEAYKERFGKAPPPLRKIQLKPSVC